MTNVHSKTRQMAVCCQNLPVGALSRHSALSVLVGTLFKKFGLFLNTLRIYREYFFITRLLAVEQTNFLLFMDL